MLIHLQFSIVDLRDLVSSSTDARLSVPSWPIPLCDEEFVRSTGIVRKRPNGGLNGWVAEERYCDARRAIRLDSKALGQAGLGSIRVAFRRFYFDGTVVAKFEIGFDARVRPNHKALNELLAALLTLRVAVARPGDLLFEGRLVEMGAALANLYACASNRHRSSNLVGLGLNKTHPLSSLVIAGTPAVFVEVEGRDIDAKPPTHRVYRINMNDTTFDDLIYWRNTIGGRSFPVWAAVHQTHSKVQEIRNLRVYMLRLNAENQALIRVLKAINSEQIKPVPRSKASNILQEYLNRATSNIVRLSAKSRAFAAGNDKLLSIAAAAAEQFLSAEERQSVLAQLRNLQIRKNIFDKIEKQEALEDYSSILKVEQIQHSIGTTMTAGVFISYRRDDSKYQAWRICEAFERVIPRDRLFMDTQSIPLAWISSRSLKPGFVGVGLCWCLSVEGGSMLAI